jgi:hypothetical protein
MREIRPSGSGGGGSSVRELAIRIADRISAGLTEDPDTIARTRGNPTRRYAGTNGRAAGAVRPLEMEEAFEFLTRHGIQKTLGTRPMRKTVEKFIGDAVRDALKSGARSSGILTVSTFNDRLIIQ